MLSFTYDQNGDRLSKSDGITETYFEYDEDGKLVKDYNEDRTIDYILDDEENTIGFIFNNETYTYETDVTTDNVVAILNESNDVIARYEYDSDNNTTIYGKDENGDWIIMNDDSEFVGSVNPYRYSGFYYDVESGYYYFGGRFYNVQKNEYYVSDDTSSYINSRSLGTAVDEQAKGLLKSSSFGNPVNYSDSWYSESGSCEIIARLIYAENNVHLTDQPAIAWVIENRYEAQSSTFGKTFYDIATKKHQFSSIHPGTDQETQTKNARKPDTSSSAWSKATWLACAVTVAGSRSSLAQIQSKPSGINKQCYFVGVKYAKSHMSAKSGALYYNGDKITNATLVSIETNMTTMTNINKYGGKTDSDQFYNVFFSYIGDSYF